MKQNKRFITGLILGVFLTLLITLPIHSLVSAEQSGSTPNSGATSYIKQLYDSLVSLGNGSDSSGSWGDWGNVWNRIRSSSEWVPSGDATAGDVVSGKKFYGGTRELVTGTAPEAVDWSDQMLSDFDDGSVNLIESIPGKWENTLPYDVSDGSEVWKDEITGLYWSHYIGSYTHTDFDPRSYRECPFAGEIYLDFMKGLGYYPDLLSNEDTYKSLKVSYDGVGMGSSLCGDAINICATLELDADGDGNLETKWYLPTQKEFLQAYNNGIYIYTNFDFVTYDYYWSSTANRFFDRFSEVSYYPWYVSLVSGEAYMDSGAFENSVRCVYREELEDLEIIEIEQEVPSIDPPPPAEI